MSVTSPSGPPRWPTTPPPPGPLGPNDPASIGRYRLEAVLGTGGMGRVYLSRTPGGTAVAIKVVHREYAADSSFRKRFEQEVATARRVQGLYTAPVVDADVHADEPWLATAYIPGPSLRYAVAEHGPLPVDSARRLVGGVAEALQSIHAAGVIHRDLKPSNVILTAEGPKVIDFGIARAVDVTSITGTDAVPGTPAYMAPEYLRGNAVTPAADVFALGALAVFAATGRQAFGIGSGHAVMLRILELEPDLDACPEPLRGIAAACLTKDPRQRPAPEDVVERCQTTGDEGSTVVDADLGAEVVDRTEPVPTQHVAPQPGSPHPPSSSGRGRWLRVAAALAAVAVLVGGGKLVANLTDSPSIETWDDTLYPREIESVVKLAPREDLLGVTSTAPEPVWTTPIRGGDTYVLGGDADIVLLRFDTYLLGLDPRSGKQRWPVIDLGDFPTSCAVRENRIGCVSPASNGSDSTVLILDTGSGKTVEEVKVPNRELRSIVVADDRFVAVTQSSDGKGLAVGYTTEGDEVWRHEGHPDMYVSTSAGILVDTTYDAEEVVFVSTADGREVLRSGRAEENRDLVWNVFHGGIAIQNEDWTGTDIYDLEGEKQSSVAGWEPVGFQSEYSATAPLPLLHRLEESSYPDENTVAAANPETGHLLWRKSGEEVSRQLTTVGDQLIMKAAADVDAGGEPTGASFVRVYDAYTGEARSASIEMTGNSSVEVYWIKSDGYQLIYTFAGGGSPSPYVMVGYDMDSGEKRWELPLEIPPGYPGGKIVAAGTPETVSLFG